MYYCISLGITMLYKTNDKQTVGVTPLISAFPDWVYGTVRSARVLATLIYRPATDSFMLTVVVCGRLGWNNNVALVPQKWLWQSLPSVVLVGNCPNFSMHEVKMQRHAHTN